MRSSPPDQGRPDVAGVPDTTAAMQSSLSGLSIQQILDLDVENLAVKIDTHHCQTKKAVLDHFMETKARLLSSQTQAVEEERREGNSRLGAKQAEIDLLKQELQQALMRISKQSEFINRMSIAVDTEKHRKRTLGLLHRAFRGWCHHTFISRRAKQRMVRAERWHAEELLQRHVLRGWFRVAMQQGRVTTANRCEAEVKQAKSDIAAGYEGQIQQLRQQLQDTRQQLVKEAEAREKLEENMKQAFMRGVCALNIEAMSIMKRGAPPGGANPVPVTLTGPAGKPGQHGMSHGGGAAAAATVDAPSERDLKEVHGLAVQAVPASQQQLPGSSSQQVGSNSAAGASAASSPAAYPGASAVSSAMPARAASPVHSWTNTAASGSAPAAAAAATQPSWMHPSSGASPNPAAAAAGGTAPAGMMSMSLSSWMQPSPGASPAAPALGLAAPGGSSTAQSYYQQRPKVTVTRGPEVPKPRPVAPAPTRL